MQQFLQYVPQAQLSQKGQRVIWSDKFRQKQDHTKSIRFFSHRTSQSLVHAKESVTYQEREIVCNISPNILPKKVLFDLPSGGPYAPWGNTWGMERVQDLESEHLGLEPSPAIWVNSLF